MKVGIVLATTADFGHAIGVALAARRARHEVAMFFMDAGCVAAAAHADAIAALVDADCELFACSNSAVGLALHDGIARGSQDDHAAVVGTSDRLVAFT